ncbi:hypothetical protein ABZT04_30870 [Streptomyces sp. NPDC005492]
MSASSVTATVTLPPFEAGMSVNAYVVRVARRAATLDAARQGIQ